MGSRRHALGFRFNLWESFGVVKESKQLTPSHKAAKDRKAGVVSFPCDLGVLCGFA